MENRAKVSIYGGTYSIQGEAAPEYIERLARFETLWGIKDTGGKIKDTARYLGIGIVNPAAARHPVFFPEGYEGEQYGAPKEHDLGESQAGALQAEKDIRPGGIEGELDEK